MSRLEEKTVVVTTNAVDDNFSAGFLTINRPSQVASQQASDQLLPPIHGAGSGSTHSLTPPGTASNEKTIETTYVTALSHRDMYNTDLEAQGLTEQKTAVSVTKTGLLGNTCSKVDSAWPGRHHIKQQRRAAKLQRSRCGCWAGLKKSYKALIIAAIVLAILGIALGLGFGVSQKVGGTINDGTGDHKPAVPDR